MLSWFSEVAMLLWGRKKGRCTCILLPTGLCWWCRVSLKRQVSSVKCLQQAQDSEDIAVCQTCLCEQFCNLAWTKCGFVMTASVVQHEFLWSSSQDGIVTWWVNPLSLSLDLGKTLIKNRITAWSGLRHWPQVFGLFPLWCARALVTTKWFTAGYFHGVRGHTTKMQLRPHD